MSDKIQMKTPLVDIDGDEMTGDLARICKPKAVQVMDSFAFLDKIGENLSINIETLF